MKSLSLLVKVAVCVVGIGLGLATGGCDSGSGSTGGSGGAGASNTTSAGANGGEGGVGAAGAGGSGGSGASGGAGGTGAAGGSGGQGGAGGAGGAVIGGWTEFVPQPGAAILHLANDGDDGAPGTEAEPKATLQAGYQALQDGSADWLLLKRGDEWTLPQTFQWTKSGPLDEGAGWMRLGAYGDEAAPRPVIDSVLADAFVLTPGYQSSKVVSHVAISDVHFIASGRLASPQTAPAATGIFLVAVEWQGAGGLPFRHVLLENVKIQGFGFGITTGQDVEDLRLRRSIVTETFNPGGQGTHGSGILSAAQGLLLEENVFYRNQHPDTPGVTEISDFAHSAYITAEATDVVCVGNFIIKATEGFMVRAGGVYERNVSTRNKIGSMFGQAYGVTPTPGGVDAMVRDNLFLDNTSGFYLGNAHGGTVSENLLLNGPGGAPAADLTLIGMNAQGMGANIGVHDVAFEQNFLTGDFVYTNAADDPDHYSGLSFTANTPDLAPLSESVGDYLSAAGIAGTDIDDLAAVLVARDRATFTESVRTTPMLDFYRAAVGLPPLSP